MLICRKRKNKLPKRLNLKKTKKLVLSHNAALRRDVMRAKLERSETGTRCGIALERIVSPPKSKYTLYKVFA